MFQTMIAKLRSHLTWKLFLVGFGVLAIMALLPHAAHAETGDAGNTILGYFLQIIGEIVKLIMKLMGFILLLFVQALIWAAQYSNFVAPGPTAVRIGWIVTRDLANMFFIVVLLISAFSTIIGYSKYRYDAVLPRLLITAVMINFSKTIVGLFIDFSQVVMLTFVNGFAPAAGGNFLNAFQIVQLLKLSEHATADVTTVGGLLLGYLFALIMVTVATAVVAVLTIHLVVRIVELWILIIMAPIAFIAKVIPGLDSMYGEWWGKLTKLLIAGPKIAFFIWLALITAQQSGGNVAQGDGFVQSGGAASQEVQAASAEQTQAGIPTDAATADTILSMIIMIAILMAGLDEANKAVDSNALGKAIKGRVQSGAKWAGGLAKRETIDRAGGALLRAGGGYLANSKLARVPGLGGLGRAAALKGESIKASRSSAIEKFSGNLDDVLRLSPNSFKAMAAKAKGKDADKVADALLKNKKAQADFKAEAKSSRDKAIAAAQKKKGSAPLTDAEKQVIKGRSTLDIMNENLAAAKKADPNDGGKLKDMQAKFWQQMTEPGSDARKKALSGVAIADMDNDAVIAAGRDLSDRKAKELLESDNPDHRNAMLEVMKSIGTPDELRKQLDTWKLDATKIPDEFFNATSAGANTASTVAGYALDSSRGDAQKMSSLMSNSVVATQVQAVSLNRVNAATALAAGTANRETKINAAVVDGINTGAITTAFMQSSSAITNALKSSQLKAGDLAKHADGYTPEQSAAAKTAVAIHIAANPDKEKSLRKNPALAEIMPSVEEVKNIRDAAVSSTATTTPGAASAASQSASAPAKTAPSGNQVKSALQGMQQRLTQIENTRKGPSNPFQRDNDEEFDRLTKAVTELKSAVDAREAKESTLRKAEDAVGAGTGSADTVAKLQKEIGALNETIGKLSENS